MCISINVPCRRQCILYVYIHFGYVSVFIFYIHTVEEATLFAAYMRMPAWTSVLRHAVHVCVCVCVCVCVSVIHTHLHIYMHTYVYVSDIYTYIYMYIHTVEEAVQFSADMRLPASTSAQQRAEIISRLIADLGLQTVS